MRYKTSNKKILSALSVMLVFLLIFTNINTQFRYAVRADLIGLFFLIIMGFILLKLSYVEINGDNLKYVNLIVERYSAPIKNIISIGYPEQSWFALYSYMYILYDDPNQPGNDKVIKVIRGQFDEDTLSKIADDLKSKNPSIVVNKK